MTYEEIKIILIKQHKTIAGLAAACEEKTGKPCRREEMSQCIRQVKYRVYPELRKFLAEDLGYTEQELFGPKKKARKEA